MNSRQQVFLDTSIQIERFISLNSRRAVIERELANSNIEFVTSSYVFMEFQRTLPSNYIHVYNHIMQYDDWETIAYTLRSGQRAYRPRSLGHCFQILTKVMDKCEGNRNRALDFLKIHITQDLPKRFWYRVTPLPDPIICNLVQNGIPRQQNGQYSIKDSCRKEHATCHLPNFLTRDRSNFHLVAEHLSVHPKSVKHQERLQHLIDTVIENPQSALGQAACWPLSDVIIALQVPSDTMLWTLDKDFGPLIYPLNIRLYTPTYDFK